MKFTDLPRLNEPLEGGIFAGVITQQDGTHCAVVMLPTRLVAALLFTNLKPLLIPR